MIDLDHGPAPHLVEEFSSWAQDTSPSGPLVTITGDMS